LSVIDPVTLGSTLTYTLTVHNNGPATATGVTVTDNLPSSVTFVSASAGCTNVANVVTCTIGTLANGATATATINVTVNAVGTVTNTATATGNEPDPDPSNGRSSVGTNVQSGTAIPASSPFGLMLTMIALAAAGWFVMKRT
jgi:conserved repeat domain